MKEGDGKSTYKWGQSIVWCFSSLRRISFILLNVQANSGSNWTSSWQTKYLQSISSSIRDIEVFSEMLMLLTAQWQLQRYLSTEPTLRDIIQGRIFSQHVVLWPECHGVNYYRWGLPGGTHLWKESGCPGGWKLNDRLDPCTQIHQLLQPLPHQALSLWSICTKHGHLLQTCTPRVSNVMILKVVIHDNMVHGDEETPTCWLLGGWIEAQLNRPLVSLQHLHLHSAQQIQKSGIPSQANKKSASLNWSTTLVTKLAEELRSFQITKITIQTDCNAIHIISAY